MKIDLDTVEVVHNSAASRFEATVEGQVAVLDYQRNGTNMLFTHTGVPRAVQSQGVAGKLAHTALEYAREQHLNVVPLCSYIVAYLRRHPEYQDLVNR